MRAWIKWFLLGGLVGLILSTIIFYLLIPFWGLAFIGCGFAEGGRVAIAACEQDVWQKLISIFIIAPTIVLAIISGIIGFFKNRN